MPARESRPKYDRSLNGLKKDLEANAYFDRDGNVKILSMYTKHRRFTTHTHTHTFIDKIERFKDSSLSCQKYLLENGNYGRPNKLKLVGQRMCVCVCVCVCKN